MGLPFPQPQGDKSSITSQAAEVQGQLLCTQTDEMLSEAGATRTPALKDLLVLLWARLIHCINQL